MAIVKNNARTWMFGVLVLTSILAASCNDTVNKTPVNNAAVKNTTDLEEDDDDFDFSVFDKTPAERKKQSEGKLADSIVKAVKSFKRENENFSLTSLLSGLFGRPQRTKRRIPESRSAIDHSNDQNESSIRNNDHYESVVKTNNETKEQINNDESDKDEKYEELLNFDSFLTDDSEEDIKPVKSDAEIKATKIMKEDLTTKIIEQTTKTSNINRIPKRVPILSRRPKSLNDITKMSNEELSATDANIDQFLSEDNLKNLTGVDKFYEVYSAQRLVENWGSIKGAVEPVCRHQLGLYLVGLTKHELWALKMDDASGRYTSGYYWGNAYWTGSADLCDHVAAAASTSDDNATTTAAPLQKNGGLSQLNALIPESVMTKEVRPPFLPSFFIAKLQINETNALGGPRMINLGLCLPAVCTARDVQSVLEMSRAHGAPSVLQVRAPHHQYFDMFADRTFQILAGISVVVLGLMIAGSLYELALGARLQSSHHADPDPAAALQAAKTDQGPKVMMANGKSVYSLNNGIVNNNNNNNNSEERLNIEMPATEPPTELNIFSELILSFSVISNMKIICDQTVGSDTIPTIHGLRSISMAWVILGHSCIVAFKYSDNTELRKDVEKEFLFQSVTNGAFSVDTFFCIGGILVSYIYFRTNAKGSLDRLTKGTKGFTSGLLQFIGLLAYRFARLTAPYMFMLGVVEVSMKWFFYNSVFDPPTQDHINCPEYWWRNVLYINTLFPVEEMCMLWSWYLADDSQFYVVGAVILILAASHFKTAAGAMALFLVSSWFTTGYIAWSNNHMPSSDDPLALFDKIYDKPWTRLGPYLIGMAAGWLLFKTNCKIRMSKLTVTAGWLCSTLILLYLVYGLYNTQLSPLAAAAYSSLSHTAWALAIAWIVIACSTGYGGYINTLLSATILYPFSRVTYCAYLVHPVVIRYLAMTMDHPFHLGKSMMVIIFLGQMMASFLLSFVISLAFEAPVVTMLKILAPNRRKKLQ